MVASLNQKPHEREGKERGYTETNVGYPKQW